MKKILALTIAMLMIFSVATFSGCSNDEDKGAMVQMYLTSLPEYLDPTAVTYGSVDNVKFFGLLHEGLFKINENGKLENAVAEEYEYFVDARDNTLKLEITLKDTRWSDGIPVDADDFVYSWQRLLKPENDNPSAVLLYPIKNAQKVKEGLCSINDLGICAIKDDVLQIAFEKDFTNVEYFVRRLASPVLVPLREENAVKFDDETDIDYVWTTASTAGLPITNGPFKYRKLNDKLIELERNVHYNDVSSNEDAPVDKVVKPHRIIVDLSKGSSADEQIERFENGEIFYINLSGAKEETIKEAGKTKTVELPSVYTYFFDTTSELFSDSRVTKALSIALDREHINSLTGRKTKAAEGIVPFGVEDTVEKTEFRKEADNMFAPKGDIEAAKALLKEAGVKGGNITIEYNKDRAYEKDVAEYVKKIWKDELGFKVTATGKNSRFINGVSSDTDAFATGSARVVGMDFQCVTPDAYSMLLSFSKKYSGGVIDISTQNVEYTDVNITGFSDDEYDAICDEIVLAKNNDDRASAMHKAEEYLIEKSPVAPLFCNVDVYATKGLSNIDNDKFGGKDFTKLSQKNYKKYLVTDEPVQK